MVQPSDGRATRELGQHQTSSQPSRPGGSPGMGTLSAEIRSPKARARGPSPPVAPHPLPTDPAPLRRATRRRLVVATALLILAVYRSRSDQRGPALMRPPEAQARRWTSPRRGRHMSATRKPYTPGGRVASRRATTGMRPRRSYRKPYGLRRSAPRTQPPLESQQAARRNPHAKATHTGLSPVA